MLDLNNISVEVDRRKEWAGQVDVLLMRLELLEPRDRVLIEAYVRHNVPVRLLALLSGRRRQSVARQMKRLIGALSRKARAKRSIAKKMRRPRR